MTIAGTRHIRPADRHRRRALRPAGLPRLPLLHKTLLGRQHPQAMHQRTRTRPAPLGRITHVHLHHESIRPRQITRARRRRVQRPQLHQRVVTARLHRQRRPRRIRHRHRSRLRNTVNSDLRLDVILAVTAQLIRLVQLQGEIAARPLHIETELLITHRTTDPQQAGTTIEAIHQLDPAIAARQRDTRNHFIVRIREILRRRPADTGLRSERRHTRRRQHHPAHHSRDQQLRQEPHETGSNSSA